MIFQAPEELQSLPIASLEEEKRALDYAESISVELQSGTSHCVGKEIHHQSSLEKERTEGVERRDEASNTEPAVPTSSCKDDSHDPSEFKSLLAQLRDSEDKVKELQEILEVRLLQLRNMSIKLIQTNHNTKVKSKYLSL